MPPAPSRSSSRCHAPLGQLPASAPSSVTKTSSPPRELAAKQPNLLINITNDAWFGKTSEPALHFALARFRAIELRTTLIRSTNTGISGRVDPVGRLLEQTSLDGAETLLLDVPLMTARKTLFVLAGEWPAAVAAMLIAWLLVAARRRASRS